MNEALVRRRAALVERQGHDAMHRRLVSYLAPSNQRLAPYHGVTLIELLITITIIAVLSATFLGVSRLAMESSREARTKTTIGKIHSLLMEKWAEYTTRRVDINPAFRNAIANEVRSGTLFKVTQGEMLADLRLLALREMMRMEMPDRWSDVVLSVIPDNNPKNVTIGATQVLAVPPPVTQVYRRRFAALRENISASEPDGEIYRRFQGAECLYMTVMLTTGDGEARSLFSEQDIGDTDGDGAPEFLDGWGRPIEYVRWPSGFWQRSDLVTGPELADQDHDTLDMFRRDRVDLTMPFASQYSTIINTSVASLVDQVRTRNFDPVYRYPDGGTDRVAAFRLVPLVFSSGSDGVTDIDVTHSDITATYDPYAVDSTTQTFEVGLPGDIDGDGDDNSLDNIHNHLQDNR